MKVKCVSNKDEILPEVLKKEKSSSYEYPINVGDTYVVYGLVQEKGYPSFMVFNPSFIAFPIFCPSMLFEVIDPRLSRFWVYSYDKDDDLFPFLTTFKEWALDREFFYRLSVDYFEDEEYPETKKIFRHYRQAMDLEFPDEAVVDNAQIGDETWLICPKCMDAWEYPDNKDALVVCPKCYLKYNNPRYVNEYPLLLNKNYDFI